VVAGEFIANSILNPHHLPITPEILVDIPTWWGLSFL